MAHTQNDLKQQPIKHTFKPKKTHNQIRQPSRIQAQEFLMLDGAMEWRWTKAVWQLSLISVNIFCDGQRWT